MNALFRAYITFALLLIPAITFGDFSNSDKQFLEIKNLLMNPGAEQALSSWDQFGPGGGSLSTIVTSTHVGSGAAAIAWDASANTQYLGSSLATIPAGLYGKNCLGKINFKGADSNLTFQVVDQSGSTLGSSTLVTKTNYEEATTAFTCPTSGSIGIRVTASANAAAVFVDDAYLGLDWRQQVTTPRSPTQQRFTSGSGTYTTPANVRWLRVRMVGAGGGGAGSGTASQGAGGTSATDTSFGTSLLTAVKGSGAGGGATSGGAGGTATINSPAYGTALPGVAGGGSIASDADAAPMVGSCGGNTFLGGAGCGGAQSGNGVAAAANSGSGGGGGSCGETASCTGGAGGGAGGSIDAIIPAPLNTSYAYALGAGGTAGTAGTNGFTGGAGAAGYIEVTEYYQ